MARDLEKKLESSGFEVFIVTGRNKENSSSRHAWIAFPIGSGLLHVDSIGLNPFFPEWYYEDIKIFDSYDCYLESKGPNYS